MKLFACLVIALGAAVVMAQEISKELLTVAEQSNYQATSKHAEVVAFCQKLAQASPRVKLVAEAGVTQEGRKQPLLILADPPVSTPEQAAQSGKIIVMAFANIHSGECDGKEGVLMLARELALAPSADLFKNVIFLVYPNLNADGNDRFDMKNRPGQLGPEKGMGTRANAQGLDLNRDFVKLDSPEVRALVKLFDQWNPHFIIDCHTTNGSHHRHVITYDMNKHPASDAALIKLANGTMMAELNERLDRLGGWKGFYYGNFNRDKTAWESYGHEPRYSTQYCALRQRIGILSESYSYASYKDRVLASRDFVRSILEYGAAHRNELLQLFREVAERQVSGEHLIALRAKIVEMPGRFTVLGYAEKEENGKKVRTSEPKEYVVTYVGDVKPTLEVKRPEGYLVPKRYSQAIETLRRHGITLTDAKDGKYEVEVNRITKVAPNAALFQKHRLMLVDAEPRREQRTITGSEYIMVNCRQPLGNLASFLLEVSADDGLTAWNAFDDALKEGTDFPVLRVVK